MKIDFFKATDSMYIEFLDKPAHETIAINDNINIDIDADKNLIGIDIHAHASNFNWSSLELNNVPQIKNIKMG